MAGMKKKEKIQFQFQIGLWNDFIFEEKLYNQNNIKDIKHSGFSSTNKV